MPHSSRTPSLGRDEIDHLQGSAGDGGQETLLGVGAVAIQQQPGGLGDHRDRRSELADAVDQQRGAGLVVAGAAVRSGEPDVGVDQQHVRQALRRWSAALRSAAVSVDAQSGSPVVTLPMNASNAWPVGAPYRLSA